MGEEHKKGQVFFAGINSTLVSVQRLKHNLKKLADSLGRRKWEDMLWPLALTQKTVFGMLC